jgi:hypothetical protein
MEAAALIVAILGLIPVYILVKLKLKKPYELHLNYKNIQVARFSDPQNPKLDGRLCLVVYMLHIANKSYEPTTLKDIILSYHFNGKHYQDDSYGVHTGITPKMRNPAIILSNGEDNVILVGWHNVRSQIGKLEILQPGGVFRGSAVFLFEPQITDIHSIQDLALVISDFSGNRTVHPIAVEEDWLGLLSKGFAVMNRPFTIGEDDSIQWA